MIGDADTVRETADDRQSPATEIRLVSVPLKIRLLLVAIFIVGCLLVFLPS
jgi:hypothetical protein